jgi:hypothetical protein
MTRVGRDDVIASVGVLLLLCEPVGRGEASSYEYEYDEEE